MTTQQTHHDLSNSALLEGLRAHLQPLAGDARQYDGLLALIGRARFALLREASHGTHEFYRERAEITKRLITEKGFTAVAVEADWPDAWRVMKPSTRSRTRVWCATRHLNRATGRPASCQTW